MQDIRFSIVTPTLNSEEFLAQTMRSVLEQGYRNMEHIIVDGKSTDGTLDIVREMESAYEGRLRYVSEPDDGLYDAMNKGIRMANGDVIGIMNSDDYYLPGAFAEAAKAFQDERVGIVYSDLNVLYRDGTPKLKVICHARGDGMPEPYAHQACFIRRSVHERCGVYDNNFKILADLDLLIRAERAGVVFKKVDMPLAAFRLGGISYSILRRLKDRYKIGRKDYGVLRSAARLIPRAIREYGQIVVGKLRGDYKKHHAGMQL